MNLLTFMAKNLLGTKKRFTYLLLNCDSSALGDEPTVALLLLPLLLLLLLVLLPSSDFLPRSHDSFRKLGSPVHQLLIIVIV